MRAEQHLTFDRYRMDLPNEQLWQDHQSIPLTSKAFAVLRYLVEHAGQLVTKAELFAGLWPGTAVSDGALTVCIVEIRKVLGDHAKAPRFIETVHRRGYRFLPTVTTQPVGSRKPTESSSQESEARISVLPSQDSGLKTQHSVLVGRETDLAQLHGWFAKALTGDRQLVFVTGEAGIGKTTVVEAFLSGIGQQRTENGEEEKQKAIGKGQKAKIEDHAPTPDTQHPTPWISWGQCIEQYGVGEPYMPILEALGRLCREPDGGRLIALLKQHAPTWLVQMPALLNAAEQEVLQRQTAGVTRERMLRELGEALEAITAERPLVLWLEDLHWSDASTLELLALLARRREPARLLVIGTYRPIDVIVQEHPLRAVKQELQLHGLCQELPLALLSEAAVGEYLAAKFDTGVGARRAVPLQLARTIHRRTEGNPLFLVTAVEDLIALNVLVQNDGQWAVPDELTTIETRVPGNLQQLITQQIERLHAEDRRMLEVASVAGMEFSAAAVAAGLGTETEIVEERCAGLARRGQFLRASGTTDWPDGTVAARYNFLHALYQEVLYERIPAGRRQRLHQQIGEREEAAYGKRTREIATALAVHFEQGRDYRKAVQYLQQAGENAIRRSAHQEAIVHLTKGLELLKLFPDTTERAQQELALQATLGTALTITKSYTAQEVERVYARARELCRQMGETPQLFPVLFGLLLFYVMRGEQRTALELEAQFHHLAQRHQDPIPLVEAHYASGLLLFFQGAFTPAHTSWTRCLALYEPQQAPTHVSLYGHDPGISAGVLSAFVCWLRGYPEQAVSQAQAALALAYDLAHPNTLTLALFWVAYLYQGRREAQAVQAYTEEFLRLVQAQGNANGVPHELIMYGWALAEQGQAEEGIAQIREGLAAARALGIEAGNTYPLVILAEAHGKGGHAEEGLTVLAEAFARVNTNGDRFYEAELYRLKGELTLQKVSVASDQLSVTNPQSLAPNSQAEAEACFRKAIEIARQQQAKSWELRATTSLARLWQNQGKHHEACHRLSEIYDWFTEGFDTKDLQEAKALLEKLSH